MTVKELYPLVMLFVLSFFISCTKDDPFIPNEEELITTLNYTLTSSTGSETVMLSFKDIDGDGGNPPTITTGTLSTNQTYTCRLELLNESASPVDNITAEIEQENEVHQFFLQSSIADLKITYNDQDVNGHPLGLSTILTTGSAASGAITIILRHEPNKSATGVSDGDISNAGGETDIEVSFPIDVQ